jgi:hypothetical protein
MQYGHRCTSTALLPLCPELVSLLDQSQAYADLTAKRRRASPTRRRLLSLEAALQARVQTFSCAGRPHTILTVALTFEDLHQIWRHLPSPCRLRKRWWSWWAQA